MVTQLEVVSDNTGVLLYEKMCSAIVECHRVDEVKDIRDKAIALEKYSQQAKNHENERMAREIRLRAERKAGELLAKLPKAKTTNSRYEAALDRSTRLSAESKRTAMDRNKIHKDQAHKWERIASIPEAEFEEKVKEPKASTKNLSDYAKSKASPEPVHINRRKPNIPPSKEELDSKAQVALLGSLSLISRSLKRATLGMQGKDQDLAELMERQVELPSMVMNELRLIKQYMGILSALCPCPLRKKGAQTQNTQITSLLIGHN